MGPAWRSGCCSFTYWPYPLATGAPVVPLASLSLALLVLGFVSLGNFDPAAARRQEPPLFFASLRPLQMAVPVSALALACLWLAGHT